MLREWSRVQPLAPQCRREPEQREGPAGDEPQNPLVLGLGFSRAAVLGQRVREDLPERLVAG